MAAVSLHDTNTLFVSSGITRTLGYQQDMLIGQSLLGYLYPRDRLTFVSFLSQGLQARFSTSETADTFIFYVRIREYKGLKGGFEVAGAKSSCKPFQLKCSLKDICLDQPASKEGDMETVVQTICFIIIAIPLVSAHKCKCASTIRTAMTDILRLQSLFPLLRHLYHSIPNFRQFFVSKTAFGISST